MKKINFTKLWSVAYGLAFNAICIIVIFLERLDKKFLWLRPVTLIIFMINLLILYLVFIILPYAGKDEPQFSGSVEIKKLKKDSGEWNE